MDDDHIYQIFHMISSLLVKFDFWILLATVVSHCLGFNVTQFQKDKFKERQSFLYHIMGHFVEDIVILSVDCAWKYWECASASSRRWGKLSDICCCTEFSYAVCFCDIKAAFISLSRKMILDLRIYISSDSWGESESLCFVELLVLWGKNPWQLCSGKH